MAGFEVTIEKKSHDAGQALSQAVSPFDVGKASIFLDSQKAIH
jgi:hypothetical protein